MEETRNSRCYISGKMNGLEKEEYEKLFKEAVEEVGRMGMIPVNPCDTKEPTDGHSYILKDLIELDLCSAIYMLENYEESDGANLELQFAKYRKIEVIFQGDYRKTLK